MVDLGATFGVSMGSDTDSSDAEFAPEKEERNSADSESGDCFSGGEGGDEVEEMEQGDEKEVLTGRKEEEKEDGESTNIEGDREEKMSEGEGEREDKMVGKEKREEDIKCSEDKSEREKGETVKKAGDERLGKVGEKKEEEDQGEGKDGEGNHKGGTKHGTLRSLLQADKPSNKDNETSKVELSSDSARVEGEEEGGKEEEGEGGTNAEEDYNPLVVRRSNRAIKPTKDVDLYLLGAKFGIDVEGSGAESSDLEFSPAENSPGITS